MDGLAEYPLRPTHGVVPERLCRYVDAARSAAGSIDCFDYVSSDPATLLAHLDSLPRGRFCEWGSGMGVGVAIADLLGFLAVGLEIHPQLARESRRLLADHGFGGRIVCADYFDQSPPADVYFVYCWPGQANRVLQRFRDRAAPEAKLLFFHGADRVRCFTSG